MSGNLLGIECKSCRENYRCEECEKMIKRFVKKSPIIYQFCDGDLNKFVLLLRKGVYPYEYIDTQPANIGPQDVPRTSPFQHPQDVP